MHFMKLKFAVSKATEVISRATEVISRATEVISKATEIISRATEVISKATEIISRATEIISRATEIISRATEIISNVSNSKVFTSCLLPPASFLKNPRFLLRNGGFKFIKLKSDELEYSSLRHRCRLILVDSSLQHLHSQ
ncbi:hypothetical protein NIES4103_41890 [Nostoc sp. NIES-4103]|nr:hypothetical protein NIES4103_41890 [Nostoc sp. NIES-4103]